MDISTDVKLEQLFANSPARLYTKGDIIICADHDPESVMLIEKGIVEQYDLTPAGNKMVVNRFKPKAFFPMSWAINKMPNRYFFSATTNVTIRYVSADKAVEFIKHNPDVAFDLLRRVFSGADGMTRRLVLASSGSASDRVVFELLNEAYRFGKALDDASWRLISIRQQNVAERCGLARETVSRELIKLERDGLIAHAGQGLLVCIDKLERRL